jgi:hypothetical protein
MKLVLIKIGNLMLIINLLGKLHKEIYLIKEKIGGTQKDN